MSFFEMYWFTSAIITTGSIHLTGNKLTIQQLIVCCIMGWLILPVSILITISEYFINNRDK